VHVVVWVCVCARAHCNLPCISCVTRGCDVLILLVCCVVFFVSSATSIKGDDVKVPVAIFAPVQTVLLARPPTDVEDRLDPSAWHLIVTADSTGTIQVFENKDIKSR
jgi:hypothetical protein